MSMKEPAINDHTGTEKNSFKNFLLDLSQC